MNQDPNTTDIVLVDDHQIMLDGLTGILQGSDYHIVGQFTDGKAALDFLMSDAALSVKILVTDISMPILNGIDLCRKVKALDRGIGVVMLSMYNSSAAIQEALKAEADGFLVKSASKTEFLKALHKIEQGGTYFSEEILPFLYQQIALEREQHKQLAILTEREREILVLIAQELTSDDISERLFISKKTVDNHRANMLLKTQSKSTVGLVKFAIRSGLLEV
jgi:two-component system, NarL family, nitrate/nitrite response regulator NarL